jgi:hypothetical protein
LNQIINRLKLPVTGYQSIDLEEGQEGFCFYDLKDGIPVAGAKNAFMQGFGKTWLLIADD